MGGVGAPPPLSGQKRGFPFSGRGGSPPGRPICSFRALGLVLGCMLIVKSMFAFQRF